MTATTEKANWPDVALALIDFAREDTVTFIIAITPVLCLIRTTYEKPRKRLLALYSSARKSLKKNFPSPDAEDQDDD